MEETGKIEGEKITLSQAKKYIKNYTSKCSDTHLRSFSISSKFLKAIIEQEECEYVKFYLCAPDENVEPSPLTPGHSLVVVGADANKTVILKGPDDDDDNEIYEHLSHCPPNCNNDGCFED